MLTLDIDIRSREAVQHPVGQPLPVSAPGRTIGQHVLVFVTDVSYALTCSQDMVVKFAAMNPYDLLEASEKAVSVSFKVVVYVCPGELQRWES